MFVKKVKKPNGSTAIQIAENQEEVRHINDVLKDNEDFAKLELIKEGMFQVYQSKDEYEAREKFVRIEKWICQIKHFYSLSKWWKNLNHGRDIF